MAYEYNDIIYDTGNERLAKLLEAIRQKQKTKDRFRIRIKWVGRTFRPYEGYIVKSSGFRPITDIPTDGSASLHQFDKLVYKPALAWRVDSSAGKLIEPALIDRIDFASKRRGGCIFSRETDTILTEADRWIEEAAILETGTNKQ